MITFLWVAGIFVGGAMFGFALCAVLTAGKMEELRCERDWAADRAKLERMIKEQN